MQILTNPSSRVCSAAASQQAFAGLPKLAKKHFCEALQQLQLLEHLEHFQVWCQQELISRFWATFYSSKIVPAMPAEI
jgi:hypothetical protein